MTPTLSNDLGNARSVTNYLSIIVAAALVNNVALVQLLGVSSLFFPNSRLQNALELALLNFIVLFAASVINLLLFKFILLPLELAFLKLIVFVATSACITTLVLNRIKLKFPLSMRQQKLAFYLTGGNSAVIGVSIINSVSTLSISQSVAYSLGAAIGFSGLLIAFAALRLRLDTADVPAPFRGTAIQLVSAGIVAMLLLGFAGLV
ncbi:MAG: electron transport complex subunit RsxA [SAR86 cluster bacterium]|uniref:Electron transport complex subunit RsxA n=1 Tax=SAR86 cluster bacterium TaxID=2030880 RepID=A0A2A5AV51_9GAMM|nr:MAG: electron transport complex subunit RsxA [SAR86 cluster bacterium]